MKTTTTEDRINFVRNRIAERRALADGFRKSAIGALDIAVARESLEQAKLAEAYAEAQARTLAMLFDVDDLVTKTTP